MNQRVILALIAIIPAVLTAFLGYLQGQKTSDLESTKSELKNKNISFTGSKNPNNKELI
jgi:hypothetical protein